MSPPRPTDTGFDLGMPPDMLDAVLRATSCHRRGDRGGEAMARFELGGHLVGRGSHTTAAEELERAGRLFVELGSPLEAAVALFNAAAARCLDGRPRASLDLFAAAQEQLDKVDRHPPAGYDLDELRIRVQAAWLDALIDLEHDDPPGGIDEAAIRRADAILALTAAMDRPDAAFTRHTAHYHRARLLAKRNDVVDALPSARIVAEYAERTDDAESRAIGRQMRVTIAAAQSELGESEDAGRQFVAAARLAAPDRDVATVELVLLGLGRLFRRDQARLAELIEDLPARFAAKGDRASTARLLFAHASARDLTPGPGDLDRKLSIVTEFREAAELFAGLGEIAREADARYCAAHALSDVALLHEEHRDAAVAELEHAERLFREVANWHGVGIALFGEAELLNRWYPDVARDDARIQRITADTIAAFQRAERPAEEASARLMQAVHTALRSDDPDLLAEQCFAAFESNERGRASRLLPTDRELHDSSIRPMVTLLAGHAAERLRTRPDDERNADLVWGLDQIAKGRSLSDELAAPALWQDFLARDPLLRQATGRVEEVQVTLEAAVRSGDPKSADDARAALDSARKAQRRRLQDLTDESATALDLTSIVPVHRDTVMDLLGSDETFVSLTACGSDRYLRTRLTSAECTVDVVEAASTFFSLLRQRNHEKLSPAERQHLHERGRALLGPVPYGASLTICPDTSLVTLPWHILDDGTGTSPLGDHVTTSIVPAAGVLAHLRRRRGRDTPQTGYLGIADRAEHGTSAASEIAYIRDRYFPRTGRTIIVDDPSDLSGHHGHVGVLHIGTHAHAGGLHFGASTVTPLKLAEIDLTAELLLLTGCYLGAFAHDDNNEFFGIVRQLLVATGARAAVVSAERVVDKAAVRFAELLVSALTGTSIGRPWGPVEPMAVGDAVRWARLQMRELGRADLSDPQEAAYWRPARRTAWWSPWFVIGDAAASVPMTVQER